MIERNFENLIIGVMFIILIALLSYISFYNFKIEKKIKNDEPIQELTYEYDVIVIGSDPEGVAAAVSAARNDQKTLLVSKRKRLGGLMTLGGLNTLDMNYGPNGEILTQGIFLEFLKDVSDGDLTKTSFNTQKAELFFEKIINKEDNLTLYRDCKDIEVLVSDSKIKEIKLQHDFKDKILVAKNYIDSTQDADIAYEAGVPYTFGREDMGEEGKYQAATLIFGVGGVDWEKMRNYIKTDKHSGADDVSGWGFFNEMKSYEAKSEDIRMRGLNIGREDEDSVLINAMHIFNVNPLDGESKQKAYEKAKEEAKYIVQHMKENIPGFEDAFLEKVMDELYIRESRHIIGGYRLTINDVLENRDFTDKIAYGSYPVDIQATTKDNWGFVVGVPDAYTIPFRSLVPKKIDNLLVASRSSSYTTLAHGSTRVIPVGMSTGQAAGVAAAYSNNNDKTFREIASNINDIKIIQNNLKHQGAFLEDLEINAPNEGHWALDGIRELRKKGQINTGYNNDYSLNEKLSLQDVEYIFMEYFKRTNYKDMTKRYEMIRKNTIATVEQVCNIFNKVIGFKVSNNREHSIKSGYFSTATLNKIKEQDYITRDIFYMMLHDFNEYLDDNSYIN